MADHTDTALCIFDALIDAGVQQGEEYGIPDSVRQRLDGSPGLRHHIATLAEHMDRAYDAITEMEQYKYALDFGPWDLEIVPQLIARLDSVSAWYAADYVLVLESLTKIAAENSTRSCLERGLIEMIVRGRLKESDIPDDYLWLVKTLGIPAS